MSLALPKGDARCNNIQKRQLRQPRCHWEVFIGVLADVQRDRKVACAGEGRRWCRNADDGGERVARKARRFNKPNGAPGVRDDDKQIAWLLSGGQHTLHQRVLVC